MAIDPDVQLELDLIQTDMNVMRDDITALPSTGGSENYDLDTAILRFNKAMSEATIPLTAQERVDWFNNIAAMM